jgi:RNA polymerase primary sigma factor
MRRLLNAKIDFVPNPSFHDADAAAETGREVEATSRGAGGNAVPADLPGHLARLCEAQLLTAEEETALFRRMNFLKFQAGAIRTGLDLEQPDMEGIERAERCLAEAGRIRDRIVESNLRLAMSVVKKFVSPQHSYDEVLSDGICSLMQAVEKFDYDRGFRFSTYAYRAITRNLARKIHTGRQEAARWTTDSEGSALEVPDERGSSIHEEVWHHRRGLLTDLVGRLDRRERFIIRSRYALGAHRKVRSFQDLADKLGVSKERVRQLEQRAVSKLRGLAAERPIDEFAGAALV